MRGWCTSWTRERGWAPNRAFILAHVLWCDSGGRSAGSGRSLRTATSKSSHCENRHCEKGSGFMPGSSAGFFARLFRKRGAASGEAVTSAREATETDPSAGPNGASAGKPQPGAPAGLHAAATPADSPSGEAGERAGAPPAASGGAPGNRHGRCPGAACGPGDALRGARIPARRPQPAGPRSRPGPDACRLRRNAHGRGCPGPAGTRRGRRNRDLPGEAGLAGGQRQRRARGSHGFRCQLRCRRRWRRRARTARVPGQACGRAAL